MKHGRLINVLIIFPVQFYFFITGQSCIWAGNFKKYYEWYFGANRFIFGAWLKSKLHWGELHYFEFSVKENYLNYLFKKESNKNHIMAIAIRHLHFWIWKNLIWHYFVTSNQLNLYERRFLKRLTCNSFEIAGEECLRLFS